MDPYRFCIWCGVDCYVEDPPHAPSCPQATGLYPVRAADLKPNGMRCIDCSTPFEIGEYYIQRPTDTEDVYEIICVGCGASGVEDVGC